MSNINQIEIELYNNKSNNTPKEFCYNKKPKTQKEFNESLIKIEFLSKNKKIEYEDNYYTKEEILDKLSYKYKCLYSDVFFVVNKSNIYVIRNYKITIRSFQINRIISFLLYIYYWLKQDFQIRCYSYIIK